MKYIVYWILSWTARIISYILAGIVGLLLYGLLFSVTCSGQSPALLSYGAGSSYQFTYTDIPSAPSDGTSATLTFVSPGNILNTTGGDTQNKYLDGAWTTFRAFSLVGTEGAYRRMINLDGDVVIGSSTNAFLFNQAGTGTTNYGIYGLSAEAPMFFDSVGSQVPTAAIQSSAFATGPNADFQNIVNRSGGYLFFANTAGTLSGGDASTPTQSANNYGKINLSFARSFNAVSNKEHIYIGATTNNTYAIHTDLTVHNVFTYNSGWDAIQIGNATDFSLTKSTFIEAGTSNTASQNALLQIANAYGVVEDCIFMDAPQGLRLSTLKLTFNNNYVKWNGNTSNEIISYYGNYAASNRLMVTVDTVWITNSDFVSTTWTGAAFRVLDPDVIIVVKDCNFSGPTSLFQDDRISPTGSLIDGGGNVFGATIPEPTFSNYNPIDFTGHGLLTEKYHHMKGRGYRTP